MTNGSGGKPKPTFFIAVAAVILGLLGFAFWRCSADDGEEPKAAKKTDKPDGNGNGNGNGNGDGTGDGTGPDDFTKGEKLDPDQAPLMKEDYKFVPSERLPDVPGTAEYASIGTGKKRVVRFAINVWAGWAPILYANGGKGPGKIWKDSKGEDFQVELVLIDNPVDMGNTFAAGKIQIGWATVDMLPLIVQRLNRDPRTMPRVYQQIDWSNGGDGIVVRDRIKSVADLRGETVVLAENSPSHYFLLNVLMSGGVQPSEVKMKFTQDAFQASAAFKATPKIAGCVSWAPDIFTLEKIKGNHMLVDTLTANKLIADVWFARADFAREEPEIIEGLVRGILDATSDLADSAKASEAAKLMDEMYDLPPGTGQTMLADAHWTNYAENRDFLLDRNNPTNFERTYNNAFLHYKSIGAVDRKVPFDQIMDFSVIKKLGSEAKYADQKNEYQFQFAPVAAGGINVESAILTKTVVIGFFPQSFEVFKKVPNAKPGGEPVYYDPNVEFTIEEIAKLAGQFGAARIQIEGHTDSSMKGVADDKLVRDLSLARANSVKQALVNKFKTLNPEQFVVAGFGWDKPADPSDPLNQVKNRRVEIRVIPAEAQ